MALSNLELEQIYQYLITKGKKDSQLSAATLPLTGNELIAIVKSGVSVSTTIKEIIAMATVNNLYNPVIVTQSGNMDKSKYVFITTNNVTLTLPDAKQCSGRMFIIKNLAPELTGTFEFSSEQGSSNLIHRLYGGNPFDSVFSPGVAFTYSNGSKNNMVSVIQTVNGFEYANVTTDKDASINFTDTLLYNLVTKINTSKNVDDTYQTIDNIDVMTNIENSLYIRPTESLILISDGSNWINIKGNSLTQTTTIQA